MQDIARCSCHFQRATIGTAGTASIEIAVRNLEVDRTGVRSSFRLHGYSVCDRNLQRTIGDRVQGGQPAGQAVEEWQKISRFNDTSWCPDNQALQRKLRDRSGYT